MRGGAGRWRARGRTGKAGREGLTGRGGSLPHNGAHAAHERRRGVVKQRRDELPNAAAEELGLLGFAAKAAAAVEVRI
jgi:hypothetical protein